MAIRASTRLSIRWPPAEASEPTDTLVLSVGDYYVDLRTAKSDQSIDWALAGQQSVISENPAEKSCKLRFLHSLLSWASPPSRKLPFEFLTSALMLHYLVKVKFTHPFDSHYVRDQEEQEPDIGEFSKLPNGDDLETGVMAAPHLDNKIMPYEEVWHELDPGQGPAATNNGSSAWVIESVDEAWTTKEGTPTKSHYAKAGKYFLGLRRMKPVNSSSLAFSAIRQEWSADEGKWTTIYKIGDVDGMFVQSEGEDANKPWKEGDKVEVGPRKEMCIVRSIAS